MNFTEVSLKTIPAAAAAGWSMWGFTLTEWSAIFAIGYSALMIFFLLKDRFKKWRDERNESSK